jgi:ABC transporter substrate binding protein (PQQ-dependent alcohol dehydrogenase system)
VNSRFEKKYNRRMNDRDWAAWIAVKAVSEAVRNKKSIELADIRADLLNQKLKLDAFKGGGYSFRPWDNQLRQPVLMVTDNWVASVTPLKAFLHSSNNLDTLGFDQPESKCNF